MHSLSLAALSLLVAFWTLIVPFLHLNIFFFAVALVSEFLEWKGEAERH